MKKISVKKAVIFIILAIIAVFLVIWLGCLLRNYVLTIMHADEIKKLPLYEGEVAPDYDLMRVLSYSENEIKVYFVEKVENHECELGGIGIYRRNIYGEWSYIEDILWSTAGTADTLIWPYWHHIVYYFAP